MLGRRVLALLLVCSMLALAQGNGLAGAGPAPSGALRLANQSSDCMQLAWYAGQIQGLGESIDSEESGLDTEHMETWTAADYDAAIAIYQTILNQWDSLNPPPAAAEFHQTIRDGIALFQEAMGTMKTAGPFALLAYLDQFDALNKKAAALALPLEAECNVALFDNDGDGQPEIGPGVATPVSGDDGSFVEASPISVADETSTEAAPIGLSLDGRPIMPIGTSVQLDDAFALTIVSVDQNATDAVSEPAPDGYQYVNVEMTLTHLRDQTDTFDLIRLLAIGSGGAIYSAVGNSCGVVDGPLSGGDYTGTMSMTGHVCFTVNTRDLDGLMLYDQSTDPATRTYLSLDPNAAE